MPLQGEDFQEEALVFSFGLALVLLRREDVQPSFFSSRNLESRDKKQGWMTMTFLKFLLVSNLLKFPEQLKMETLTSVLKQLETPLAFHKAFPAAPAGSEEAVKAVPEESVVSEVNKLTEDQKRFFGLIRDLYEGEYDEDLRCVLAGKNFKLLYDMSSPASENKDLGLCLGCVTVSMPKLSVFHFCNEKWQVQGVQRVPEAAEFELT